MHIKKLFTRSLHYQDSCDWSPRYDERCILEAIVVIASALVGTILIAALNVSGRDFSFWFWGFPSIIMTAFVIWRILIRSCGTSLLQIYFPNFIWRGVSLAPSISGFQVALYVLKAFMPVLNWVCVIAGIVSMALCTYALSCPIRLSKS